MFDGDWDRDRDMRPLPRSQRALVLVGFMTVLLIVFVLFWMAKTAFSAPEMAMDCGGGRMVAGSCAGPYDAPQRPLTGTWVLIVITGKGDGYQQEFEGLAACERARNKVGGAVMAGCFEK